MATIDCMTKTSPVASSAGEEYGFTLAVLHLTSIETDKLLHCLNLRRDVEKESTRMLFITTVNDKHEIGYGSMNCSNVIIRLYIDPRKASNREMIPDHAVEHYMHEYSHGSCDFMASNTGITIIRSGTSDNASFIAFPSESTCVYTI